MGNYFADTGSAVGDNLAVLKAKIKIKNPRNRAGIGPTPTMSLGKWQYGPSPGTLRAKEKIKNNFKHSQDNRHPHQCIALAGPQNQGSQTQRGGGPGRPRDQARTKQGPPPPKSELTSGLLRMGLGPSCLTRQTVCCS